MRYVSVVVLAVLAAGVASFAAYESSMGIKAVPAHLHHGKPINFKFSYDFSHGLESLGGMWRAFCGGGRGDGAFLDEALGLHEEGPGLEFNFAFPPGGDTWALLNFKPGRFSIIDLGPKDGVFFRARTEGLEMDGYPGRWYLQARFFDGDGKLRTYRTPDIELLPVWQTYYVSAWDFGDGDTAGLFAGGAETMRLFDLSFVPNPEKYREDTLYLDALVVYAPGRKVPGIDTDGDGIPDFVDGDDDNDGILDFTQGEGSPLVYRHVGYMQGGGRWEGRFRIAERNLEAGDTLSVDASIRVASAEIARAADQIPEFVALLVGERRYDRRGRFGAFSNHMISPLLTPTGFPIENYQNSVPTKHVTSRDNVTYSSPIDAIHRVSRPFIRKGIDEIFIDFRFRVPIDESVPEGWWRLYFEFGIVSAGGYFQRLDSFPFEARRAGVGLPREFLSRDENLVFEKKTILPLIRIGAPARPRMPWALLMDVEVHGVRGIVPEEERGAWALNARNRLEARPIYPPGRYNLEPGLPSLAYPALNISYPMNARSGEMSVRVTGPDGETADLGTAPFRAMTTWGPTTRTGRFVYDFTDWGEHTVTCKGWILDAHGNRFEGGGTYKLWIARRITFGTFPSLPYMVGQGFHGAVEVVPPVEADMSLTVEFYPHSDPARKEVFHSKGKANRLGLFVAKDKYVFREPGEYKSIFKAEYRASDGTLWMGSLWGAMMVAPVDTLMIVHGRTGYMRNGMTLPTDVHFILEEEGLAETDVNIFLFYPYYSGDVMYIASTMDHHNSVYPLLTMAFKDGFVPYDGVGGKHSSYATFTTHKKGWQPYCFREGIKQIAYYYTDAWRPGVSGRHIIASGQVMNSYWSTSPSLLGRQMHTCENGDLPGDYYRFTGGIVYRDLETGETRYGVYASMGVVTEKGTMRTGVVEACSEPLFTLNGRPHTLFLGGGVLPVPGMILLEGGAVPAGGASNPPVPADLETTVISPSGKEHVYRLKANAIGVFPRSKASMTPLVEPGVWRARQKLSYAGKTGDVLGSGDGEYTFFVAPKDESICFDLQVDLPPFSRIGPGQTVLLAGSLPEGVTEGTLHYSTISPGLIIEEGKLPVEGGKFAYEFNPWAAGERFPFYDTVDYLTGRPALCDTVVFNLFFEGKRANGEKVYGVKVVAMRGDAVINANVK